MPNCNPCYLIPVLLALLGGCAGNGAGESSSTERLNGGDWRLQHYGNLESPAGLLPGTSVTLRIDSTEGRISGTAGCNSVSGSFSQDGDRLTLGPLATTKKMCLDPEGIMEQENRILHALHSVSRFSRQENTLTLYYGDNEGLIFSREPTP